MINPNDSSEIVNAVINLVENDELRRKIVANGYKFAEENTIEKHATDIISFISDI